MAGQSPHVPLGMWLSQVAVPALLGHGFFVVVSPGSPLPALWEKNYISTQIFTLVAQPSAQSLPAASELCFA